MRTCLPNLIIAGVNKAATTSLFTYLGMHPEICASSIKETHYFMPLAYGEPLPPIETYAAYFKHCSGQRYRMEASPRYIFGGNIVAKEIRRALPDARIIFVLRQPIDRMVSYFRHMENDGEVPGRVSCDEYARRAIEELPAAVAKANGKAIPVYQESIFVRGLAQGFYADYLKDWYEVFGDSIRIVFFDNLSRDPSRVVKQLCGWLGLDTSVYEGAEFTQENRTMRHKNATLFAFAERINTRFEPFWRRHQQLKDMARSLYCRLNEQRTKNGFVSDDRKRDLEQIYAPYNRSLVELLRSHGYNDLPKWLAGHGSN